ncbi:hypothetical protein [Altericista sp. CCNU0014]|uniref:hypothetical protein n=1 Tax=Altericista sp. CCNU0014 TaxID=3082949 RepID=UPI00384CEB03
MDRSRSWRCLERAIAQGQCHLAIGLLQNRRTAFFLRREPVELEVVVLLEKRK